MKKNRKAFAIYLTAALLLIGLIGAVFMLDRSEAEISPSEKEIKAENRSEVGQESLIREPPEQPEENALRQDETTGASASEAFLPSDDPDSENRSADAPDKKTDAFDSATDAVPTAPADLPESVLPEVVSKLPADEITSGLPGAESAPDEAPDERTEPSAGAGVVPGVPEEVLHASLSVTCVSLLGNSDLAPEKAALVPSDGVIYSETAAEFYPGESVFNLLSREMRKNGIHMEFASSAAYRTSYVEGIGNLYEFDAGELSGWMYRVNGVFPSKGCSAYILSDGDNVEWVYTCDLGKDVGAEPSTAEVQKNDD